MTLGWTAVAFWAVSALLMLSIVPALLVYGIKVETAMMMTRMAIVLAFVAGALGVLWTAAEFLQ